MRKSLIFQLSVQYAAVLRSNHTACVEPSCVHPQGDEATKVVMEVVIEGGFSTLKRSVFSGRWSCVTQRSESDPFNGIIVVSISGRSKQTACAQGILECLWGSVYSRLLHRSPWNSFNKDQA